MTKPQGVRWLEDQTGQTLERDTPVRDQKHLSLRLSGDLALRLERYAADRGETVSMVARRFLAAGLDHVDRPDARAIDATISLLETVRGDLGLPATQSGGGSEARRGR